MEYIFRVQIFCINIFIVWTLPCQAPNGMAWSHYVLKYKNENMRFIRLLFLVNQIAYIFLIIVQKNIFHTISHVSRFPTNYTKYTCSNEPNGKLPATSILVVWVLGHIFKIVHKLLNLHIFSLILCPGLQNIQI